MFLSPREGESQMTASAGRLPQHTPDHHSLHETHFSRRELLLGASTVGLAALANRPGHAQAAPPRVAHTIRIAPISLEIAPNKVIQTTGYNGTVPGPLLRLKEGTPVTINVINDSGYPNLIHWHGLFVPPLEDGAVEEGSPIIPPGESLLYSFIPKPAGTRWYHSHAMAMTDLNRSTFSGEFGFLVIEPDAGDPGRYEFKSRASRIYCETKTKILDRIIAGAVIHADETGANIRGHPSYVWVLTNLTDVVYILAVGRRA
jgi:FtsP/CotA-like multicopper oxidase with cupredoxin domain